jgi:hypothetical protein
VKIQRLYVKHWSELGATARSGPKWGKSLSNGRTSGYPGIYQSVYFRPFAIRDADGASGVLWSCLLGKRAVHGKGSLGFDPRLSGACLASKTSRPARSLRRAFIVGNSILSTRRAVIPCLPPAVTWPLTEGSSLSWEVLVGCLRRHTVKMWISVFAHGVEAGVAFTNLTAWDGIGTRHVVA